MSKLPRYSRLYAGRSSASTCTTSGLKLVTLHSDSRCSDICVVHRVERHRAVALAVWKSQRQPHYSQFRAEEFRVLGFGFRISVAKRQSMVKRFVFLHVAAPSEPCSRTCRLEASAAGVCIARESNEMPRCLRHHTMAYGPFNTSHVSRAMNLRPCVVLRLARSTACPLAALGSAPLKRNRRFQERSV